MESIIAVDMKFFLLSNGMISDHHFRFRPSHSTLDMLLLLYQHWMEGLNLIHQIRVGSSGISQAFTAVRCPAFLSKLSTYGTQHQLYKWLTDFLYSCRHNVAFKGILSSPLPVKDLLSTPMQCFGLSPTPNLHQ